MSPNPIPTRVMSLRTWHPCPITREPDLTSSLLGFFYIINFGLDQEQVDRQFAIGKQVFQLPTEEKLKYRTDLENGGYNGYKPFGLREIKPGVFDNTEIFNIPTYERPQPEIIKDNWEEIGGFAKHINDEIVRKLLTLYALILELPEDFFTTGMRRSRIAI